MVKATTTTPFVLPALLMAMAAAKASTVDSPTLADAAEQGDTNTLAALLDKNADPNGTQADGMTALLWAAYHDDKDTAKRLIEAGASVTAANR